METLLMVGFAVALVGFVVFAGTVVMALHMIIKAGVELARIRKRTASSVKGDGNE